MAVMHRENYTECWVPLCGISPPHDKSSIDIV